jgi:hypothetical protein
MSRNDPEDFAERLYARVPAHYRVYDTEQGQPLLSLLRVIGEQVANIRQDLDALWDDFFIETCDDWVVPYIGALLGTNLLAQEVGQSNRLDVWNTVIWRRSKGTPRMLDALSQAISEWPTDLSEFFQMLGWSQQMNHIRADAVLTPDLHDPYQLSLLGRAADPFAHAADFRPARPLDQARVAPNSLGIGRAGWGTPGRYQIKNLGLFVRRLQMFPVKGATPASVAPGAVVPPGAACFTFDPLFRDMPLFVEQSRMPITRAAFDRAPWETFGSDVAVRQFGVLLASEVAPQPDLTRSRTVFTFGGAGAGLALDATTGMRLLEPRRFQLGGAHFVITAEWHQFTNPSTIIILGALSTLHASLGNSIAFEQGAAAPGPGQLVLTVQTGRPEIGWSGPPALPASPAARFPGAIIAVRAARIGPVHAADGLYVYLPAAFVTPADRVTYYVADDGSTYATAELNVITLARASEGQVYPPRLSSPSTAPADAFTALNRASAGMRFADPTRIGGAGVLVQLDLFTGAFQALGAVATIDQTQTAATYPDLQVPDPWPALSYGPSKRALAGDLPSEGILSVQLVPLAGDFIPPLELIVSNRRGQSLLVYLPEVANATSGGVRFFVADDGSTYVAPGDAVAQLAVLQQKSYSGLILARKSAGRVLPIAGVWPLQQRRPVAIDLCRCERRSLLAPGELGIDPELGRFAFAPQDPAIGPEGLSVDYVEAFSDRVGALNYDRQLDPQATPRRLVSQSGDVDTSLTRTVTAPPVYSDIGTAIAAAQDGDVIEIADSATYAAPAAILLNNPTVKNVTVRAGVGQRPCLTFYQGANVPASSSFRVVTPMSLLDLSGLLISGGPLLVESKVEHVHLTACTLDPRTAVVASLIATDMDVNDRADYLLCRCIIGGVRLSAGVSQITIADSIIDQRGGFAIAGPVGLGSPPFGLSPPLVEPPIRSAGSVQLERVTVLGRISCGVLNASDSLLDDIVTVEDQQAGCIRFTRYEIGSVLPRRFQCVPSDAQAAACGPPGRCYAPLFNSRRFGRPDYMQLAAGSPPEILTASEARAEVGVFASTLNPIRLSNLQIKLQEFMPVSLSAVIIADT